MLGLLPSHTVRYMFVALNFPSWTELRPAGNPAWQMSPGSERGLSIIQNSATVCDLTATNPRSARNFLQPVKADGVMDSEVAANLASG